MKKSSSLLIGWLVCCLALGPTTPLFAQGELPKTAIPPREPTSYFLKNDPDRPRALFWPQFGSFVLPGLDQWWEGQYDYAATYTGMFGVGLAYTLIAPNFPDKRHAGLGAQLATAAGGFSAYHSFRSAVNSRRASGEFEFLTIEEKPSDIFIAPLHFNYLIRPSTFIPVGVALLLAVQAAQDPAFDPAKFTLSDGYFALGQSYLAGTWEEAVFRGWLMPLFRHYSGNSVVAVLVSSTIFAALHYNGTFIPVAQLLLGTWLGGVSVLNGWTLSESIFIHSWWDAVIFSVYYSMQTKSPHIHLPIFTIPL